VELVLQDVDVEEKFDVIISEWMGYMLLYEVPFAMLFLRIICIAFHKKNCIATDVLQLC
jgi:hypothetical protein